MCIKLKGIFFNFCVGSNIWITSKERVTLARRIKKFFLQVISQNYLGNIKAHFEILANIKRRKYYFLRSLNSEL